MLIELKIYQKEKISKSESKFDHYFKTVINTVSFPMYNLNLIFN